MAVQLNREERVLRVIQRKEVDYLPSQIEIADRSRYGEISAAIGLGGAEELDNYLENHLYLSLTLDDKPIFFRDVREVIDGLAQQEYCKPDWDHQLIYDRWGVGICVGLGSFFTTFHPTEGKAAEHDASFMPAHIGREVLFGGSLEERIKYYKAPDPNKPGNFSEWESDLKEKSGEFLVWPSGYMGIYERTFHLTGWENFMALMASDRDLLEELLDKVVEYKIEVAKKTVQLGFKLAHTGDDLGAQQGGIFSEKMFREVLLPRMKRHWKVFTDAGIPIMLHSCGNITAYIPYLLEIGLSVLEPCQPAMDLGYLKREFGKHLVFMGGIDTQALPFINAEQTKEMTRNTIRTLGQGGGYIIGPSQEIMNDVPTENIKALVETIKEERARALAG